MTKKTAKPVAKGISEQHIPMIGLATEWWRSQFGLTRYVFSISLAPASKGCMIESEIDEESKSVMLYFGKFIDLDLGTVVFLVRDEMLRILYRTSDEAEFINTITDGIHVDDAIQTISEDLMPSCEEDEPIYGEDLSMDDEKSKESKKAIH